MITETQRFEYAIEKLNGIPLPESLESERLILSNLLCDKHGEAFDCCSKLKPYHFMTRSNAIIFDAMLKLHQSSKATDLVTVNDAMQANGKLEEIGGQNELNKLFGAYLTLGHTQQHVDILMEKYRLRKIIDICEDSKLKALNHSDSNECLSHLEHQIFDLTESDDSNENQTLNACDDLRKQIETRRTQGDVNGLLTGVKPFDGVFFGLQAGQYYVLGGLPSAGKTAMVDQVCGNLLLRDIPILYISLESDRVRVLGKIACKIANVAYWNFIRNRVTKQELDEVEKIVGILEKKELILMRPFDIAPMDLRPLVRKCKRKHNIQLVILDYLQKVAMPSGWDERRTVSRASTEMGRASSETGVPSIVLCQLNRDAQEGSRPSMRNLKESSQIEQDADNVALIWSEVNKRDDPQNPIWPCILSVDKNKDGASGIDIEMEFEKAKMRFSKRL